MAGPAVAQSAKARVQQAQQFKKKITKTLHLSWVPAYADPALYEWLFQQRRQH